MIFQKLKRGLGILLGKERELQPGLNQRQTKQLTLARTVVDQEDGGVRHHYKERYQQGLCLERMG